MTLELATGSLVALLLATVRTAAWLVICPPFSTRAIPGAAKGAMAAALALPVVPRLAGQVPSLDLGAFAGAVLVQVVVGTALGFITYLVFAAVQAAGDLIDLFGGFTLAAAYDPLSLAQSSVFGRLHQMLATVLLFATGGHLLVVRGFLSSYDAVPLDGGIDLGRLGTVLTTGLGHFFVSALQIAAPLVAVLFIADLGLGLLTRVAPSLNALSIGFPVKIGLTLLLVGLTFPLLPGVVTDLVDTATRAAAALGGG